MADNPADNLAQRNLDDVVRGIAAAAKALKLYPPTSPIPRQSITAATASLDEFLAAENMLSLSIARGGLTWRGQPVASGVPGIADLADALRDHDIAEIAFMPGCSAEELISFLEILAREPDELSTTGGLGAALASAGVEGIRAVEVQLTVAEDVGPAPDEDVDEFLRELAGDADRLSTWMAAAAAGDPAAFAEGLGELTDVAGPEGIKRLQETLAAAFEAQEPDAKDALIGLSLEPGGVRDLAEGMFGFLGDSSIAGAVTEGAYGQNVLSVSHALSNLPLQERIDRVYAEVQAMLAEGGHTDKEGAFLEHMMEVRRRTEPEPALIDADSSYVNVAEVAKMEADEIVQLREQTEASTRNAATSGVTTMLTLLDQQRDFELYCESVDGLAGLVPRLIEEGNLELALRVLRELSVREARTSQPWPELTGRLREAIAKALSPRSIRAIVTAVAEDESLVPLAKEIMALAGDTAAATMVSEGISLKQPGLAAAEAVIGRHVLDLLIVASAKAQWFQLAPIAERLAREGDTRSMQLAKALLSRQDEQSRREVAQGLAAANTEAGTSLLGEMISDGNTEVAIIATRALGRSASPSAAALLAKRLGEIDVDSKDFLLARELIGALARRTEPEATDALKRLSERKALIKRGHHAEVQELVRQAIALQSGQGGAR